MITWTLDQRAITRACKKLKLQYPVTVTLKEEWWAASYDVHPLHSITVNPTEPVEEISYTIWHELTHALQCERDYNADGEAYHKATDKAYKGMITKTGKPTWKISKEPYEDWLFRYFNIPIEAEAEATAMRYASRYPLIKS